MNNKSKNLSLRHIVGALTWVLCAEYFICEYVTIRAWVSVPFSFRFNYISDLGATSCTYVSPKYMLPVCSPLHALLNASLMLNGALIIIGSILLRESFPRHPVISVGLWTMAIGSFGLIGVGLVPENTNILLHTITAASFFLLANSGLLLIGIGMSRVRAWPLRTIYTIASGVFALIALIAFLLPGVNAIVGVGIMERLISYPFIAWLISMGISLFYRPSY